MHSLSHHDSESIPMECDDETGNSSLESSGHSEVAYETFNGTDPGRNGSKCQTCSSLAPIPIPPAIKVMSLDDEQSGSWKGIQGTGRTSMFESIVFSLFNSNSKFAKFLCKGGTTEERPKLPNKFLGRMIRSLYSFPYSCPDLYTHYFANSLGLERFHALIDDPQSLISSLFEVLGHDVETFNHFSDSIYTFSHRISIEKDNSEQPALLLEELLSQGNMKTVEIRAPVFLIYADRILSSRIKVFPSLCIEGFSKEPLELGAIICTPDSIKTHCHTAFVRFKDSESSTMKWWWFNPEGRSRSSLSKECIPEVESLPYLEEELTRYAETGMDKDMSCDVQHILIYGNIYVYYSPQDPRILEYIRSTQKDPTTSKIPTLKGTMNANYDEGICIAAGALTHGKLAPIEKLRKYRQPYGPTTSYLSTDTMSGSLGPSKKLDSNTMFFSALKIGNGLGIKQKDNSCYVDTTLFCLFYTSKFFDSLIMGGNQIQSTSSTEIMTAILENIVASLRTDNFVPSEDIQMFRETLYSLSPNLNPIKMADVDEFIQALMGKALNLPKFIRYTVGTGNYLHLMMLQNKSNNAAENTFKDLQTLFYQSMAAQELKLKAVPNPALIIKMARSNGKLIRDRGIIPNLTLDIYPVLQNAGGKLDSILHLHSVILLNRLHYTAFVRCGTEVESPWLYFDSIGPEIRSYPDLGKQLLLGLNKIKEREGGRKTTFAGSYGYSPLSEVLLKMCTGNHVCIYVQVPVADMKRKEDWKTFD